MAENEKQSGELEDRLGHLLSLFGEQLTVLEQRTAAIEAALPRGLTEVAKALVIHRQAISAIALGVHDILEGGKDGAAAEEMRRAIEEVTALKKMFEDDGGK